MIPVGIEAMQLYSGLAKLDLKQLAMARNLDPQRFEKLLMVEKSVVLPNEDAVSYAVNAAKPLLDRLSEEARAQIELLIVCTESGIDFSKSVATYVHDYLRLGRNCRLFELKQACYSGTAGLQMAANFVLAQTSATAKALVIATDIARFVPTKGSPTDEDWSYAEPSSGAGAVALLVSNQPHLFQLDVGCSGYYGYEVMDTARPAADTEFGDADLSLLSYLDCCEHAYQHYVARVDGVDYQETFQQLAFHTPFGGMVKGAHQMMMRKFKASRPEAIQADFAQRVLPGLYYCQRVGNIMGATLFLALAGIIDRGLHAAPQRVGLFAYGSGCCSEFFSGVITPTAQPLLAATGIADQVANRYALSIPQYEAILQRNHQVAFGTRNVTLDEGAVPEIWSHRQGQGLLRLCAIKDYYRHYEWI